eukprot:CAMPEP_0172522068 /NCGR_PEP_ID=MMETSP1066-20121228/292921_1 /TAXON_ID=671091 /ORGANISM="Coscinodiscus wailesii, Strain CCMP2513" /LENGTH=360 /DNA_ID=CAMNT_0013305037 /DNA_START=167 /DNA_END=1249 /DNA_ORIENTATION=+
MASSLKVSIQLWNCLREEAEDAMKNEPLLSCFLQKTILHPNVNSFGMAVAYTTTSRLLMSCDSSPTICGDEIISILKNAMMSEDLEYGHTMLSAVAQDVIVYKQRDPARHSILEVVLFFKGFASLVCHHAAKRNWNKVGSACRSILEVVLFFKGFASLVCHHAAKRNWNKVGSDGRPARFMALWLQSQASAVFGVDIHPDATIGAGVMIDHATGVVIGEAAVIGDGCTLLHGVTLGSNGKESGDRHPKIGDNVFIGAGTSILGNIKIGCGAKIGAGSVVLKPIPHGATAVGAPAKVIGWTKEKEPTRQCDSMLSNAFAAGIANIFAAGINKSKDDRGSFVSMISTDLSSDDESDDEMGRL